MLTVHTGEPAAPPKMQAGAAGYLSKGAALRSGERYSFGVFRTTLYRLRYRFSRWRSVRSSLQNGTPFASLFRTRVADYADDHQGSKVNEISEQLNSVLKR